MSQHDQRTADQQCSSLCHPNESCSVTADGKCAVLYDPLGVHSDEYNVWWRTARRKGWKLPTNTAFPDHSWLAYWKAMDAYEHGESAGRPVPPHRSGRSV